MATQPLQPPDAEDEKKKDDELSHVDPEDDVKMTIWEHIGELRKRIVRAGVTLLAGAVLCWTFKEKLLDWVGKPFEVA